MLNCSAGPADLQAVVSEMLEVATCPVIVQANAGLPEVVDGQAVYALPPDEYARAVLPMIEAGATIIGGCCGTDPAYIGEIVKLLEGRVPTREPVSSARLRELAAALAQEGGRDAEILELILDAPDREALRESIIEEFDD